jgi:hypothetical protein
VSLSAPHASLNKSLSTQTRKSSEITIGDAKFQVYTCDGIPKSEVASSDLMHLMHAPVSRARRSSARSFAIIGAHVG